jgi:hypothetical protein
MPSDTYFPESAGTRGYPSWYSHRCADGDDGGNLLAKRVPVDNFTNHKTSHSYSEVISICLCDNCGAVVYCTGYLPPVPSLTRDFRGVLSGGY